MLTHSLLATPYLHLFDFQYLMGIWGLVGLVFTFLSGTECPGFEFVHDSFGLLRMADTPLEWTLSHCSHEAAKQAIRVNDNWIGSLNGSVSAHSDASLPSAWQKFVRFVV